MVESTWVSRSRHSSAILWEREGDRDTEDRHKERRNEQVWKNDEETVITERRYAAMSSYKCYSNIMYFSKLKYLCSLFTQHKLAGDLIGHGVKNI